MTGDDLIRKYQIEDHIPAKWPTTRDAVDQVLRALNNSADAPALRRANAELISQRNDLIHYLHLAMRDRDLFRKRYLVAAGTAIFLTCFAMGRLIVGVIDAATR